MEPSAEERVPIIRVTAPSSYQSIPNVVENSEANGEALAVGEAKISSEKESVFTFPLNEGTDEPDHLTVSQRNDKISTKSESGSIAQENNKRRKVLKFFNVAKIVILVAVTFFAMVGMAIIESPNTQWVTMSSSEQLTASINVETPILGFINVNLKGPFIPEKYKDLTAHRMDVQLKITCANQSSSYELNALNKWQLPIPRDQAISVIPDSVVTKEYDVRYLTEYCADSYDLERFYLTFETNTSVPFPFSSAVYTLTQVRVNGAVYSALVLLALYILIGFELVHRTLAAMIASTMAILLLTSLNEKPSLETIMSWVDVETLVLLFSMMVLVAILCETGFFDYIAVLAYKLAKGSQWPLITTLCLFTAVISAFLDNVTTILLITPVTIRLCEVMGLDPRHVLVCIVLFSNIGGAATPIGDPPNVIIISNEVIVNNKIDFLVFTQHLAPGIILCLITGYIFIRLYYMRGQMQFTDPPEVVDLRHEIEVWKRACNSLPGYTHEEDVVRDTLEKKIAHLEKVLQKKKQNKKPNEGEYKSSLKELEEKYKIKNKGLLIKSAIVLVIELCLFFTTSIPQMHLSLGWVALFGAMILLILADFSEIESIIARVEWTTLVFFSALFVLMKAVEELGLLEIIGTSTENFVSWFDPENQLNAAMMLVLWISAVASTFIDNIPFTTAMIPVIGDMAMNLNLPLQPLVWALAFGACLGGNGSLIGASANVVCAGISENHGYRFTFMHFFKVGFPMMLITTATAAAYLLVCHSAFQWNY